MASLHFLISKFDESIVHMFVADVDFSITGLFLTDIPDGLQIDTPTDYADLKAKKQQAYLDLFPDFPNLVYNELDTAVKVDTGALAHRAEVGPYEWMLKRVDTNDGRITTTTTALGATPVQLVPYWTCYSVGKTPGEANDQQRLYTEEDASAIVVEISTDNGANWDTVTYEEDFVSSNPGSNLKWRFTNKTSRDIYLGHYAVLWRS